MVARAGLARGDKVLAAARADDGTWLVGSRDHLALVAPRAGGPQTIPPRSRRAVAGGRAPDWNRDEDRFRITKVGEYGRARARSTSTSSRTRASACSPSCANGSPPRSCSSAASPSGTAGASPSSRAGRQHDRRPHLVLRGSTRASTPTTPRCASLPSAACAAAAEELGL